MCPPGRRQSLAGAPPFRSAFDVLDADCDGKISSEDLRTFYSGLPSCPSEEDISSMISAADADRDGFVQFGEFERVLGRSPGEDGVMEEVFRVMDRDGDGVVGFEDLKAYLGWAGLPGGDEDIRAMIRMGGAEDSGGVGLEAFLKILAVDSATDYVGNFHYRYSSLVWSKSTKSLNKLVRSQTSLHTTAFWSELHARQATHSPPAPYKYLPLPPNFSNKSPKMCPPGRRQSLAGAPPFRSAFDVLDADCDGKISSEDLRTFYSGLPSCPSEEDISSMISAADADRDGFVQFGEFERVLGRSPGEGGVMEEVFRVMDRDGDGVVGFEDLKAYLGWAGLPGGDEDIRAMIRMGGAEDSGGVGLEAFLKILAVDSATVF